MKDIVVVAPFTQLPGEPGNGRFHYLATRMAKMNVNVEVVTSDFSHSTKSRRDLRRDHCNYKITLLHEPGYQKNVSLKRYYSHYVLAKSIKEYIRGRRKPDVIYCAVPPLETARVVAEYCEERDVRFIIDVQDLWPEAFSMVLGTSIISDFLLQPLSKVADNVYRRADEIIAVSETYVKRAVCVNTKCKEPLSVFLGTDITEFDKARKNTLCIFDKPDGETWLAYVGTLGHSYDICSVIDALHILKAKGMDKIRFVVMGDGPHRQFLENYATKKEVLAEFTGKLEYQDMVGLLSSCDIAVNPILRGSAASIINKHGDYAAAGLPVLNTQESDEYRNLVKEWNMGLNCKSKDPKDLAEKLLLLCEDVSLRERLGHNARKLAEEKFDRAKTYSAIINKILV